MKLFVADNNGVLHLVRDLHPEPEVALVHTTDADGHEVRDQDGNPMLREESKPVPPADLSDSKTAKQVLGEIQATVALIESGKA